MSTNFYFVDSYPRNEDNRFIGKRAAAGAYCWGCSLTLCLGGESRVHHGDDFSPTCLKCGRVYARDGQFVSLELGFVKPRTERPKFGVLGCSSFRWRIPRQKFEASIPDSDMDQEIIQDEYGRHYSPRNFINMIHCQCPIEFTDTAENWS